MGTNGVVSHKLSICIKGFIADRSGQSKDSPRKHESKSNPKISQLCNKCKKRTPDMPQVNIYLFEKVVDVPFGS